MKWKLDENLSPALASLLRDAGHDAHSILEQALGGKPDEQVIAKCDREERVLITFDLDFANIQAYPPAEHAGIVVLRLTNQSHERAVTAMRQVVELAKREPLAERLWIVEEQRIRVHE